MRPNLSKSGRSCLFIGGNSSVDLWRGIIDNYTRIVCVTIFGAMALVAFERPGVWIGGVVRVSGRSLILFTVFSAFIPFSVETPVGFVSPIDLIVGCLFLSAISVCVSNRRILIANPSALLACVFFFLSIVLTQIVNGAAEVSNTIKFMEFLVLIPLAISVLMARAEPISQVLIARVMAISACVLALVVLFSTFGGGRAGEVVNILGFKVNKNGLGSLLMLGCGAAVYLAMLGKRRFWIVYLVIVTTILVIEARSAVLVAFATVPLFAILVLPVSKAILFLLAGSIVSLIGLQFFVTTPAGNYYVDRLLLAFSFDMTTITSSNSRLLLWGQAIREIAERPILGWGYGSFTFKGTIRWLQHISEPHNIFLQLLHNGGIIALGLFAIVVERLYRRASQAPLLLGLGIAYLIVKQVDIAFVRFDGHLFFILGAIAAFGLPPVKTQGRPGLPSTFVFHKRLPQRH